MADEVIVEFLRVPTMMRSALERVGIDLSPFTESGGNAKHLPLETKIGYLDIVQEQANAYGVRMSVCEDYHYDELKRYWSDPDDCCDLRTNVKSFPKV